MQSEIKSKAIGGRLQKVYLLSFVAKHKVISMLSVKTVNLDTNLHT